MNRPRFDVRPFERLPAGVAERLRPLVARLADEALPEVVKAASDQTGARNHLAEVRELIIDLLRRFCDLIEEPTATWPRAAAAYVKLGAWISREGRQVEDAQRLMSRTARAMVERLGMHAEAFGLDAETLSLITEAQLSYVDGLSAAVAQGYEEHARNTIDADRRRRQHLIGLLVADPVAPAEEVAEAAREIQWPLPRTVAVAVLHPRDPDSPPVLPHVGDVLADAGRSEPLLLVPDPDGPGRRRLLDVLLADWVVALGPTMPTPRAAESLEWAQDALRLALRGVLPGAEVIRCADHVPTLAIFRAEELIDQVADLRLAPLRSLPPVQARRLGETLLALLQSNFNATEVGSRLHVHPQTVRQRLRLLEELFGDDLRDPQRCLEIEMILHARLAGSRDLESWSKEGSGGLCRR